MAQVDSVELEIMMRQEFFGTKLVLVEDSVKEDEDVSASAGDWAELESLMGLEFFPQSLRYPTEPPRYTYTTLPTSKHLRILKLLRVNDDSAIKCELLHTTLEHRQKYEAISYTWDDPTKTHEIIIDGRSFRTSAKVYNLLRTLISPWKVRYLWIDFICINQDDSTEKKSQIGIMREIYQHATQVTVWLGESNDSRTARDALGELANKIILGTTNNEEMYKKEAQVTRRPRWIALAKLFNNSWFRRIWIVQEVVVASKLNVIYGTENFSWGELFTVMDYCSAPEMLELLQSCHDSESLDWDQEGIGNVRILFGLKTLFAISERWTLGQILEACQKFDSTEPKDRVFALLGIASDGDSQDLGLDYNDDVSQVFTKVAKYLLTGKKVPPIYDPLFALSLAGVGLRRKIANLPSWVADWSGNTGRFSTEAFSGVGGDLRYRASLDSCPIVSMELNSPRMKAHGFLIDEISDLCSVYEVVVDERNHALFQSRLGVSRTQMAFQSSKWYKEIQSKVNRSVRNPYHTGQSLDEVIGRTLIGDRTQDMPLIRPATSIYVHAYKIWQRHMATRNELHERFPADTLSAILPILHECNVRDLTGELLFESAWDSIIDQNEGQESVGAANTSTPIVSAEHLSISDNTFLPNMYNVATRISYGRRFCVTKNGYVGLVPPLTEIGDKVSIILGGGAPYLLRRRSNQQDEEAAQPEFELVGECYLHGMMDGEMMINADHADWIHIL